MKLSKKMNLMKLCYSRLECANMLGVHPQTISNYIAKGMIKAYKAKDPKNKTIYIDRESFDNFVNTHFTVISDREQTVESITKSLESNTSELREKERDLKIAISCTGALKAMISCGLIKVLFKIALTNSNPQLKEREYQIIQDLVEGCTINEIAEKHKISCERIRQIIARMTMVISHSFSSINDQMKENKRLMEQNTLLKGTNTELRKENARLRRLMDEKTQSDETAMNQKWRLIELSNCGLSFRVLNCIKARNISTVYDLMTITLPDLQCTKKLGRKGITELIDLMESYGLEIGQLVKQ